MTTKSVDLKGSGIDLQQIAAAGGKTAILYNQGINCGTFMEPIVGYVNAPCEKVFRGESDAWIIFGRDRPGHRATGYGGKGHTKAASLDLVVGRLGIIGKGIDEQNKPLFAEPDFDLDASRIILSQKTDIDANFKLVAGKVGMSEAKAAIGLKSDSIRIIARDGGIKLVTFPEGTNSRGEKISEIKGIDINAGNAPDDLQPMPLGKNVLASLDAIWKRLDALTSIVDSMATIQNTFNTAVTNHIHTSPFFAQPCAPSAECLASGMTALSQMALQVKSSLMIHRQGLANWKMNFAEKSGSQFILSAYNNSN